MYFIFGTNVGVTAERTRRVDGCVRRPRDRLHGNGGRGRRGGRPVDGGAGERRFFVDVLAELAAASVHADTQERSRLRLAPIRARHVTRPAPQSTTEVK